MKVRRLPRMIWIVVGWLAAAALPQAGEPTPDAAALRFARLISSETLPDLAAGKDTAISPNVLERKIKEIRRRLRVLAADTKQRGAEILAVKSEDPLAGAVIRFADVEDPENDRVVALALVCGKNGWSAAPVPGSFENTAVSLGRDFQLRREAIEAWLHETAAAHTERLRNTARERTLAGIRAALPAAEIGAMDTLGVVRTLLAACRAGDSSKVAAVLAGAEMETGNAGVERIRLVKSKFGKNPAAGRAWELLKAPGVFRLPLVEPGGRRDSVVPIACFDLGNRGADRETAEVELIEIALTRAGDFWKCELPAEFWGPEKHPVFPAPGEDEWKLLGRMLERAAAGNPVLELDAAIERFLETLEGGDFTAVADIGAFGTGAEIQRNLTQAAFLWERLHPAGAAGLGLPLARKTSGDQAAATFLTVTAGSLSRPVLKSARFMRNGNGAWLWQPYPAQPAAAEITDWLRMQEQRKTGALVQEIIAPAEKIDSLENATAPARAAAEAVFYAWNGALARGDVPAALAHCGRVGNQDTELFRAVCAAALEAKEKNPTKRVTAYHAAGKIACLEIATAENPTPISRLLIAPGKSGPRILIAYSPDPATDPGRLAVSLDALAALDSTSAKLVINWLVAQRRDSESRDSKPAEKIPFSVPDFLKGRLLR